MVRQRCGIRCSMRNLPKKWLVFRLSALGDVILTTGVLNWLHTEYGWEFHVVTKPPFTPVFFGNPVVTACIEAEAENLRMPHMKTWFASLAADHAGWGLLDVHGTLRSRALSLVWNGPVLRYPKYGVARRAFLLSGGGLFRGALNAVNVPQRYAMAVEKVPPPASALVPAVYLSDEERAWGKSFLANLFGDDVLRKPQSGTGIVALHPFAAHPDKAWPKEHYKSFATLLDEMEIPWIVIGKGEAFFPGDARDLTNKTSLRESAALLAACSALVSGDSGPMHLATAVGTPVIGLFGPTTREWGFFPSGPRDRVLEKDMPCRPCSLHGKKSCVKSCDCLKQISPEEVAAVLNDILSKDGYNLNQ